MEQGHLGVVELSTGDLVGPDGLQAGRDQPAVTGGAGLVADGGQRSGVGVADLAGVGGQGGDPHGLTGGQVPAPLLRARKQAGQELFHWRTDVGLVEYDAMAHAQGWVGAQRPRLTCLCADCAKPRRHTLGLFYPGDTLWLTRLSCESCGRLYWSREAVGTTCCRAHALAVRQQRRRVARRWKRAGHSCADCEATFTPPRSDAAYCSSACRQRAYRRRRRGANAPG